MPASVFGSVQRSSVGRVVMTSSAFATSMPTNVRGDSIGEDAIGEDAIGEDAIGEDAICALRRREEDVDCRVRPGTMRALTPGQLFELGQPEEGMRRSG